MAYENTLLESFYIRFIGAYVVKNIPVEMLQFLRFPTHCPSEQKIVLTPGDPGQLIVALLPSRATFELLDNGGSAQPIAGKEMLKIYVLSNPDG